MTLNKKPSINEIKVTDTESNKDNSSVDNWFEQRVNFHQIERIRRKFYQRDRYGDPLKILYEGTFETRQKERRKDCKNEGRKEGKHLYKIEYIIEIKHYIT